MTVAVKSRPIIFSADSVRAILDGRKTMTRRVVKPQPKVSVIGGHDYFHTDYGGCNRNAFMDRCPYGVPGDLLWVRRTCAGKFIWRKAKADLWLRVVKVSVERVQEITLADCRAEGCDQTYVEGTRYGEKWHFCSLWDSLNAKRGFSWDSNPPVWVIGFEQAEEPAA